MMRSNYGTLLSLAEFFEYMQLSSWLGAQFSQYRDLNTGVLKKIQRDWRVAKDACDDPYFEYIYYNGKVSRDEISRAIKQAEIEFTEVMGFPPAPVPITETIRYPEFYDNMKPLAGRMLTRKNEPKCLQTKYSKVQSLGVYTWDFLGNFAGTLADLNSDGVQETITLANVTTPSGVTCDQLEVYFRDDNFPYGGLEDNDEPEPQWKIYPIEADIIGEFEDELTWEIRFRAWQGVLPNKQINEFADALVANVAGNFATSFRVFVRNIDTDQHGVLLLDNYINPDECTRTEVESCFLLKDEDLICPKPTFYETCNDTFPNSVEVNYIAGCTRQKCGKLDVTCGMMVAFLAAARLACEPCGCGCNGRYPLHWYSEMYKERMSESQNRDVWVLGDPIQDRLNPFGPRNGDVMAWRLAKNLSKKKIHNIFP